jgi:bile acid:Na+ symporter, BASS family
LVANFVLMPVAAVVISKLLFLAQPLTVAFVLLGAAAGAPFLPKLAGLARGNLAFAVGLMVMLMVLTVAYMPIVLPMVLNGVSVDPGKIARTLVLLMMLPLVIGLGVNAWIPQLAKATRGFFNKISSLSLAILILLLLITNFQNVLSLFGTRGVLASLLFLLAGIGMGWLLGGLDGGIKSVSALGTAQRNIAAAMVVAGQNFDDPKVLVMIVVVAVVGLLTLMPLARVLGNRTVQSAA